MCSLTKDEVEKLGNLILNMISGLIPEDLSDDEIVLLAKVYGLDWFDKLGYTEPEYRRPVR